MLPGIKKDSFIIRGMRNVSYLLAGQVVTQIIAFIGFIFITRYLGPEKYGIYLTVYAFVSFFSLLTINQLNKVVMRDGSKDPKNMGKLFERTIGLKSFAAVVSIIACLVALLFTPYPNTVRLYIIIYSFNLIFSSFNGYFLAIFQSVEKMQYMSFLNVLNRFLYFSLSIVFLLLGFKVLTLVIITLACNFFTLFLNYKLGKKFIHYRMNMDLNWDLKIIKPTAVFSAILFLSYLTYRVDILIISFLRSPESVGIYGTATRLVEPIALTSTFATGLFPIVIKTFHTQKVKWRKLIKISLLLAVVMLIGAGILSIFSKPIILTLFGEEYRHTIPIFSVLIFTVVVHLTSVIFNQSLSATNNELILLKISWIPPIINIALNITFLYYFGLIGVAYATLIVHIIYLLLLMFFSYFILKKQGKIY